jgi:hypothetical protein
VFCTAHPDSVRVIKQRTMRLAAHVVCMGGRGNLYRVLFRWGSMKET